MHPVRDGDNRKVDFGKGRGMKFLAGLLAVSVGIGCTPASFRPAEGATPGDEKTAKAPPPLPGGVGGALDRATNWLISKQNPDGGYGPSVWIPNSSDVGITAFALYALARCPRQYKEHDGPYISKAVAYLTTRQQDDGAIYDPRDPSLQNYKTSVAMLALLALDRVKYKQVLDKATAFVKAQQFAEAQGYVAGQHLGYGGIGYGGDRGRPDVSNSQLGAEALHEAGVSGADDLWVRLQTFLTRCQNLETVDPLVKGAGVGSTRDGGFRYAPNATRGNTETGPDGEKIFSSYGSMTYAGLKSFLYAAVDKKDPRVQAAFNWIQRNFTVRENPGMATASDPGKGQQGLYYYYHTMAKALAAYGEPVIVDERGQKRVWAKELADHLVSLQKPEGYWDNPAERWMEGVEVLDTSYAIVTLTVCQEELKKFEATGAASSPSGGAAGKPEKPEKAEKPAPREGASK